MGDRVRRGRRRLSWLLGACSHEPDVGSPSSGGNAPGDGTIEATWCKVERQLKHRSRRSGGMPCAGGKEGRGWQRRPPGCHPSRAGGTAPKSPSKISAGRGGCQAGEVDDWCRGGGRQADRDGLRHDSAPEEHVAVGRPGTGRAAVPTATIVPPLGRRERAREKGRGMTRARPGPRYLAALPPRRWWRRPPGRERRRQSGEPWGDRRGWQPGPERRPARAQGRYRLVGYISAVVAAMSRLNRAS
ncbi:hypothetical protein DAI22_12g003000 [Oryza sativa Japonica Group]|nr:hypothetical protein DAI22_12g003000 [Oryza sativa Japonica Group]